MDLVFLLSFYLCLFLRRLHLVLVLSSLFCFCSNICYFSSSLSLSRFCFPSFSTLGILCGRLFSVFLVFSRSLHPSFQPFYCSYICFPLRSLTSFSLLVFVRVFSLFVINSHPSFTFLRLYTFVLFGSLFFHPTLHLSSSFPCLSLYLLSPLLSSLCICPLLLFLSLSLCV